MLREQNTVILAQRTPATNSTKEHRKQQHNTPEPRRQVGKVDPFFLGLNLPYLAHPYLIPKAHHHS